MTVRVRELHVHEEILEAAQRVCDAQGRFRLNDIVKALPHQKANTVRTQVTSYCCVDARQNHAHRQPYFNRIAFGEYELRPKYRPSRRPGPSGTRTTVPRTSVHAIISETDGMYVAECHEIPVITQGRSLDETLKNLREAIALHLQEEDPEELGVAANPRVTITYETAIAE
jgi:predicted RNase H-like HicB family nuclease